MGREVDVYYRNVFNRVRCNADAGGWDIDIEGEGMMADNEASWTRIYDETMGTHRGDTYAMNVPGGVLVRHVMPVNTKEERGIYADGPFIQSMVFVPGCFVRRRPGSLSILLGINTDDVQEIFCEPASQPIRMDMDGKLIGVARLEKTIKRIDADLAEIWKRLRMVPGEERNADDMEV